MKKTAIYEQVEASKHFNPYSLKDFLTRTKEGDVIVDRNRLLKTQDDLRLFYKSFRLFQLLFSYDVPI